MPNPLQSFAEAKAPPRNKLMGLVADALTRANEFATMQDPRYGDKRQNQTLGILADVLGLGSIAKTADRLSYGDPLTNAKKANVPFLKPETADAMMMAPLSPRTALAAMGMGMGDNALTRAATVWHGSPHKFDKFDASKIGTGEGAQAYGHGLYLADAKGVASSYKDKLSPDTITRIKNDVYNIAGDDNHILTIYDANGKATKTPYLSPGELDKWIGKDAADMIRAKGDGDYKGLSIDFGNLYKVDLPDEKIARMLDWDKPLSQQAPEVQKALGVRVFRAGKKGERGLNPNADATSWSTSEKDAKAYLNNPGFGGPVLRSEFANISKDKILDVEPYGGEALATALGDKRLAEKWREYGWLYPWHNDPEIYDKLTDAGFDAIRYADDYPKGATTLNIFGFNEGVPADTLAKDFWKSLVEYHGTPDSASKALSEKGLPGIRYLDGGSRGAGTGSSNYVVFAGEEEALKILERNGIPVR
jgi:hypothetical protein